MVQSYVKQTDSPTSPSTAGSEVLPTLSAILDLYSAVRINKVAARAHHLNPRGNFVQREVNNFSMDADAAHIQASFFCEDARYVIHTWTWRRCSLIISPWSDIPFPILSSPFL